MYAGVCAGTLWPLVVEAQKGDPLAAGIALATAAGAVGASALASLLSRWKDRAATEADVAASIEREVERDAALRKGLDAIGAIEADLTPAERRSFRKALRDDTKRGGKSPFEVHDMSGNVWEWTRTIWRDGDWERRYDPDDGREDLHAPGNPRRVLRGGAFHDFGRDVRCAARHWFLPINRDVVIGFRVAVRPFASGL